ncbi:hypothetical protein KP509_06G049300 [Ceratopteris richardii]|uniref:Cytochrome P450 n=1 Tax=Ceratopteris richardii TaxID=49495 RepID=A0A8T2USI1_CERRI|nr:hypothetical protein KP509_06G049300 [Ceratopteris richardii]
MAEGAVVVLRNIIPLGDGDRVSMTPALWATVFVAAVIGYRIMLLLRPGRWREWKKFPRGPPGRPLVGNWDVFFSGSPRQKLMELAKQYGNGDIVGLRMGFRPVVCVCSSMLAKELLHTHDKIFANRPRYDFCQTLFYGYDSAVIFSRYSSHLIRLRKLFTLQLFTPKRLSDLQFIRQEEMRKVISALHRTQTPRLAHKVEKIVSDMACNITVRLLQSRAFEQDKCSELNDLVRKLEHSSIPVLGDFIPWMKWLYFSKRARERRIHKEFEDVIDKMILDRHQLLRRCPPEEVPTDFLQVLLSKEGDENPDELLTIEEIKAVILDIFAGGLHTSSATVEWAMSELMSNPRVMEKLRAEIDNVKGLEDKSTLVTDEDVGRMPYLEKVIREVFRLHPVVPLLVPRLSTQEVEIAGGEYSLPQGTIAYVNAWALGREERTWGPRVSEFWPERFQEQCLDVKGQHFELLPFGSGRRMCPGMRLGLAIVHFTVANFVRFFEWQLPHGRSITELSESVGRGNSPSTSLHAIPIPRRE